MSDREQTQRFELFTILVSHCNEKLTPPKIDEIVREMVKAMSDGPCSWAFKEGKQ